MVIHIIFGVKYIFILYKLTVLPKQHDNKCIFGCPGVSWDVLVWLGVSWGGGGGGTDKSPLGQKPTRTKAHWTISHWTKAHCLIWQGGQKPTSLKKNRFKSFINQLTLIRLLFQGISHLQCVFADIIIPSVCCDKQLNLGVRSHWYLKKIN